MIVFLSHCESHNLSAIPAVTLLCLSHKMQLKGFLLFTVKKKLPRRKVLYTNCALFILSYVFLSDPGISPCPWGNSCSGHYHPVDSSSSGSSACCFPVSAPLLPADLQGHQAPGVYQYIFSPFGWECGHVHLLYKTKADHRNANRPLKKAMVISIKAKGGGGLWFGHTQFPQETGVHDIT